jgi:hypothetical protein
MRLARHHQTSTEGSMSLARKLARKQAKNAKKAKPMDSGDQMITLQNPVEQHFGAFIAVNATICQRVPAHPKDEKCDASCTRMVELDSNKGQHVVICGAGPTLRQHAAEYCAQGDQVWGCNSAATWLYEHGHRVTHGFTVDQTPQMVEEWVTAPPLEYLLASSVHPHLLQYLTGKGHQTRLFHNYVGINKAPVAYDGRMMEFEDWLYAALYPNTIKAGSGLNAVTRAIDVAHYMGFEKITVLGADCALDVKRPLPDGVAVGSPEHLAWLEQDVVMHANGDHAMAHGATPMTITGEIDGRVWTSKPDMIITAVFLVHMKRRLKDRLHLVGDTLPAAIQHKDDAFLNRLPALIDKNGKALVFDCEHLADDPSRMGTVGGTAA